MTEHLSEPALNTRKSPVDKLGYASLAVLAAFGVFEGVVAHNEKVANKHSQYESTAKTESLAAAQAATFSAALYAPSKYPKGVPMPVLNGEIRVRVKTVSGTHTGVYKDPILLATADIDARPDTSGKFLKGGWFGIRGNDANGKAVIKALPYDSSTESFKPYTAKPDDLIFRDLGVYATVTTSGSDVLIGFDENGNLNPTNPDHSAVTPGDSYGMK